MLVSMHFISFKMVLSWGRNLSLHFCIQTYFPLICSHGCDFMKTIAIWCLHLVWWSYWYAYGWFLSMLILGDFAWCWWMLLFCCFWTAKKVSWICLCCCWWIMHEVVCLVESCCMMLLLLLFEPITLSREPSWLCLVCCSQMLYEDSVPWPCLFIVAVLPGDVLVDNMIPLLT